MKKDWETNSKQQNYGTPRGSGQHQQFQAKKFNPQVSSKQQVAVAGGDSDQLYLTGNKGLTQGLKMQAERVLQGQQSYYEQTEPAKSSQIKEDQKRQDKYLRQPHQEPAFHSQRRFSNLPNDFLKSSSLSSFKDAYNHQLSSVDQSFTSEQNHPDDCNQSYSNLSVSSHNNQSAAGSFYPSSYRHQQQQYSHQKRDMRGYVGLESTSSIGSFTQDFGNNRLSGISMGQEMPDQHYHQQPSQFMLPQPQPAFMNPQKLSQVRIMQKNIVYVINLSPQIAREEVLVRFEYFGQYGKIVSVTINNEHAYNSDQGQCYSAYITYSQPHEAALAILALDQSVRENRLMRASFGRTKYCKYFLKQAQCQNRECPYMHEMCLNQAELVNQSQHKSEEQKKKFFQQCQQLAFLLSGVCEYPEDEFKARLKAYREANYPKAAGTGYRYVMPSPECIYDKKQIFKLYGHFMKVPLPQCMAPKSVASGSVHEPATSSSNKKPNKDKKQGKKETQRKESAQGQVLPISSEPKIKHQSEAKQFTQYEEIKQCDSLINQLSYQTMKGYRLSSKRSNSSDERNLQRAEASLKSSLNQNEPSYKFQEDIAQQLKLRLASKLRGSGDQADDVYNTDQEQKDSRFLSLVDNFEDDNNPYTDQESEGFNLLSNRSSIYERQRRGSFHSMLVVDTLKFLNDDTDVVPKKRGEPLFSEQQFKTSPPSEAQNQPQGTEGQQSTPAPSIFGGYIDDENYWNSTIMSNQEFQIYQQTICGGGYIGQPQAFDNKSYYSHQAEPSSRHLRIPSAAVVPPGFKKYPTISGIFPDQNHQNSLASSLQPQFSQETGSIKQYPTLHQSMGPTQEGNPLLKQGPGVNPSSLARSPSLPNHAWNREMQQLKIPETPKPGLSGPANSDLRTPQTSARNKDPIDNDSQQQFDLRSLQNQHQFFLQQFTPLGKQVNDIQQCQTPRVPPSKNIINPQAWLQGGTNSSVMTPSRNPHLSQQPGGGTHRDLPPSDMLSSSRMSQVSDQVPSAGGGGVGHSPTLNRQNLDLLDKQYEASKDFLYAKIFIQGDQGVKSKNNIFCSQSLFCYNNLSQFEDDNDQSLNKYSAKQIPSTPLKQGGINYQNKVKTGFFEGKESGTVSGAPVPSIDGEEFDYRLCLASERGEDDNLTQKSRQFTYPDSLVNANKESFISAMLNEQAPSQEGSEILSHSEALVLNKDGTAKPGKSQTNPLQQSTDESVAGVSMMSRKSGRRKQQDKRSTKNASKKDLKIQTDAQPKIQANIKRGPDTPRQLEPLNISANIPHPQMQ